MELGVETNSPSGLQEEQQQHCHALLLSHKLKDKKAERTLYFVASLSALYIAVQLVGGIWANSLAIIADSGHVLTDLTSFLISIFMLKMSNIPANKHYTFGYLRAEFIGALASLLIVWTITILMMVFATQRLIEKTQHVHGGIMLITALIGIVFNLFMALLLKYSKSTRLIMHSHGHSHHSAQEQCAQREHENVNIRAAFIHVFGDLVHCVGILIAALIIKFTDFELADPLSTYVFSLIVICTSILVARDVFTVLLEATPKHLNYSAIKSDLEKLNFVKQVHSLHIWTLSTRRFAASAHIVIEDESKAVQVGKSARILLQNNYGIHFTTIQTELPESINRKCTFCDAISYSQSPVSNLFSSSLSPLQS